MTRNAIPGTLVCAACAWALAGGARATAASPQRGFIHKTCESPNGGNAEYLLFVPHGYDGKRELPVILFLHGSGQTKGENAGKRLIDVGLPAYIQRHERTFPYLVVMPRAEEKGWRHDGVNGSLVLGILDRTLAEYKTDRRRVYLTGLSMGGAGVWNFAVAEPERWAAIVPVCGRSRPDDAAAIKAIPCWIFHGAADPRVSVMESRQMYAALRKAGGHPKYTEYPGVKHNCWDLAYSTPALWTWLAKHRRKEAGETP